MTELQNISSRPPIVQNLDDQNLAVQTSPKKPKVLSNENIDQATFPEIAIARQKNVNKKDLVDEYENYVYSEIKECNSIEKSIKYNLYAVVTSVKREPLPTRGSKMMSQVYITDISCEGTYGRSDYQFRYYCAHWANIYNPVSIVKNILRKYLISYINLNLAYLVIDWQIFRKLPLVLSYEFIICQCKCIMDIPMGACLMPDR